MGQGWGATGTGGRVMVGYRHAHLYHPQGGVPKWRWYCRQKGVGLVERGLLWLSGTCGSDTDRTQSGRRRESQSVAGESAGPCPTVLLSHPLPSALSRRIPGRGVCCARGRDGRRWCWRPGRRDGRPSHCSTAAGCTWAGVCVPKRVMGRHVGTESGGTGSRAHHMPLPARMNRSGETRAPASGTAAAAATAAVRLR